VKVCRIPIVLLLCVTSIAPTCVDGNMARLHDIFEGLVPYEVETY
jgi:hypothetical protein